MNALAQQDHEDAFFDSQMLPPQERGVTFELLYFRQLQLVTNRIHETENIDQIMLEASRREAERVRRENERLRLQSLHYQCQMWPPRLHLPAQAHSSSLI